ncbi:type IV pilus secretin PilQ family protein [Marinagarivorans algicola]|uniref:type IV pilus secretin PilQ n=1 Tax=Marinagarivorans algicola TaxID=1513270 RepID=UPI0006B4027E
MFIQYRKIAGVLSGLLMTPLAWASELQDVKFSELPGDRVEIRLVFDEAPDVPDGYTIEQPARIVLDFAEVENALTQKKFNMDMGSVSSAVVIAGGNRTRLIVNMNDLQPYSTRIEGADLVMEVGGAAQAAAVPQAAPVAAIAGGESVLSKPKNRFDKAVSEIQNIDFRRGDAGEGKIIVQLSNPGVSIDVEEVAGGIEVGFLQTDLPDQLRRKLDVTDFATPVNMIDATVGSLRSVLKIDASGEYDYLAYQADNEYVVSIKPLTRAEVEEKKAKFAYTGEKLSLNFQNIEVRSVLQLIADFTDLNLVASDTVKGSITLRLDNVPWDQALELVLKTKGLDKRQVGNVLMVAPAAEIAERERQELATQKQLEELAPLRTEYIRVRYANARELFDLFVSEGGAGGGAGGGNGGSDRNSTGSILSDRGHAIVDERTNSIILTDTEEKISDFRKVVEQIDIPIRQVMIEARIVIANNDFRKELGTRINLAGQSHANNDEYNYSGSMDEFFNNGGEGGALRLTDNEGDSIGNVESRAVNLGVTEAFGGLAMSVISGDVLLGLELTALEESGFAEIVSQPKVVTGDKQQASIANGTEIPYQEASASGAATITFKEAVLKLDVTPQITPDDNIIMDLKINQDSVGRIFQNIPSIDVTELHTQVLVADGQTVVLGGIFQNEVNRTVSKIPLLGDIPVVGRLFRKNVNKDTKRELIIFITPRIMSSTLTNN